MVGGNTLSTIIRIVGGTLQARLVEPSVLGLFTGIGLVLGYVPFLQLGINNGLNRELPYYIGKGDRDRVNELAAAAQAWSILIGVLAAIALLIFAGWQLFHGHLWKAAGWASYAVLAFLFFYSTSYLQITYRTAHDFARLAMINVIQAAVGLVLLVLVVLLNFYGLCLRALFSTIVGAALFYYWRPVRVGPRWNLSHLKHLFFVGAPIFVVGRIYILWNVVDRTLVLYYTGTHGMGLYSIVIMVTTAVELLPSALSQVIYPRMSEHYGRGGTLEELVRSAVKPMLLCVLVMGPVVGLGWLLVEPVTRFLLPKYIEAVPAIQWSLLVPLVMCFGPINNAFNVVRRQDLYLVAIVIGMAVYYGSLVWLTQKIVTLVAFPQAMIIGRTAFIVVCYFFISILLRKERNVSDE